MKLQIHPLLANCPPVLLKNYVLPLEQGTDIRFWGLRGGRASGKTQTDLRYIIVKILQDPNFRVAAGRTTDNKKDTIKQTLIEIQDIEHSHCGIVNTTDKYIEFQNGGRIELKGFNPEVPESARGFAGFHHILIDEAQWATKAYLQNLRDTALRYKTITTLSYNPLVQDEISEFFDTTGYAKIVDCNYVDNPMCPEAVIKQAELDKINDYNFYLLNWLGKPSSVSDMAVFQPQLLERMQQHATNFDFAGYIGSLDFAPGSHDIMVKTDDNVLTTFGITRTGQIAPSDILSWRDNDHFAIVGRVAAEYKKNQMQAIIVDSTGAGELVPDLLEQAGCNVIRFYGGDRSMIPPDGMSLYANNRAYSYFLAMHDAREGKLFCADKDTIKELGGQEYKYSVDGKRAMESKAIIKKKTGRSPDHADAFVMGNLLYNLVREELVLDYANSSGYNDSIVIEDDSLWR